MSGPLNLVVPDVNVLYDPNAVQLLMSVEDTIAERGQIPVTYLTKHVIDTAFITSASAGISKIGLVRQIRHMLDQSAMAYMYAQAAFTKLSNTTAQHYITRAYKGELNSVPKEQWEEFLKANKDVCPINMWWDIEDRVATTTAILESREIFQSAPVTFVTKEWDIADNAIPSNNFRVAYVGKRRNW